MKADIGLVPEKSQLAAKKLNTILADEFVLYTKTRNYHWNVEGSNFMEMHKFYETLYSELAESYRCSSGTNKINRALLAGKVERFYRINELT